MFSDGWYWRRLHSVQISKQILEAAESYQAHAIRTPCYLMNFDTHTLLHSIVDISVEPLGRIQSLCARIFMLAKYNKPGRMYQVYQVKYQVYV